MIARRDRKVVILLRWILPGVDINIRHAVRHLRSCRRGTDQNSLDEPNARSVLKARSSAQSGGSRNAEVVS